MGIFFVLLHLEKMGVLDLCREGHKVVYCLNEFGLSQKQVSNLDERVRRFIDLHRELLLRFLGKREAAAA